MSNSYDKDFEAGSGSIVQVVFGEKDKESGNKITVRPEAAIEDQDPYVASIYNRNRESSTAERAKSMMDSSFPLRTKFQYLVITAINNRELKKEMAFLEPNVFLMPIPKVNTADQSVEMDLFVLDSDDEYDEHEELNIALHSMKGFTTKNLKNYLAKDLYNLMNAISFYLFDLVENSEPATDFGTEVEFRKAADLIIRLPFLAPKRNNGKVQSFGYDNMLYSLNQSILEQFVEYLYTYFLLKEQEKQALLEQMKVTAEATAKSDLPTPKVEDFLYRAKK